MRQCQLRLGPDWRGQASAPPLDLTLAPYALVAGTWRDDKDEMVETDIVVKATTLAEVGRFASDVRRLLTMAEAYAMDMTGKPVYVYTKVCDDLEYTAEMGATWRRKRIHGGELVISPDATIRSEKNPTVVGKLRLRTSGLWERASVLSTLEFVTGVTPSEVYSGGLRVNGTVTARRRVFTEETGLTVRYHYVHGGHDVAFVSPDLVDWLGTYFETTKKFRIADSDGNAIESDAQTLVNGELVDLVFVWRTGAQPAMAIYRDGKVLVSGSPLGMTLSAPVDAFSLMGALTATEVAQIQLWPVALTAQEVAGLYAAGRPDAELCLVKRPAAGTNTAGAYVVYAVPGDGPAQVRVILGTDEGENKFKKALVGLRSLRAPAPTVWECETGTLGANTASNDNAAASGGKQARFTPANTNWATQVTLALAQYATDVEALIGDHRVLLAGMDNAASVQLNQVSWRVVMGGVASDWSDELAFAKVAQRSLLDMGILSIPQGAWPEEAWSADSQVYGGTFLQLEIQARNTAAAGTLDMDAVYLFPAEHTGVALGDLTVADKLMVLDFASDPPATTLALEEQQLEFGGWVQWAGDQLRLMPEISLNGSGLLRVWAYRDEDEHGLPNDLIDATLFVRPTWHNA